MGSHWKILRTRSVLCFRKITLTAPCRWFEGSVSDLDEMGQGYLSNTSKKQKGETQVCDCGVWRRGQIQKTLQTEYCQELTGSDGCAGVRDTEVIRMIPEFLAWWLSGTLTGNKEGACLVWDMGLRNGNSWLEMSYRYRSELRCMIWARDSHWGELVHLCLIHRSGWL